MPVKPENEMVTIVDERNRVIGSAPRHEMRSRGLIHRATYILIANSAGEWFVQKRTMSKDIFPGYYDLATGGVVLAGESYDDSARRELAEELGIAGAKLERLFDFFWDAGDNRVRGRAYLCVTDAPMTFQTDEVADGFFVTADRLSHMMATVPFTPDGCHVYEQYRKRYDGKRHQCR